MPTVGDYIERNRERLVAQYAEEVGQLPSARGLSYNEVIDTLPEFLDTLVKISHTGKREGLSEIALRLEETHLNLRLRLGFKLEEVTKEFVLLSRIIAELWQQRPLKERPAPEDVQLLTDQLQVFIDKAVEVFSGYSREEYQAEKHYLHRLNKLSTRLTEDPPSLATLGARLEPLVEVVQEAVQAAGAALFLADDKGQWLSAPTTCGLAAEPDQPVSLASSTFVAEIAAEESPVYLPDARYADNRVSAQARQSGLNSLLGLRLYPHGKLLGVLYVGTPHVQLFEPRTKRQLHMLVDYLAGVIERARLLAEVQQGRNRLQLLLDSAGEGIYGIDGEGRCTFANPACVKLLGYDSSADLIGQFMHDLIHHTKENGEPYPAEECPLLQTARQGKPFRSEAELLWRADGTSFYADQRASPMYEEGRLIAAVVTFVDVSARRRAEAERQALLEQTRQAVSAREETVRIVSHDLRSPLSAIQLSAGLLIRDSASYEQGHRVRRQAKLIQQSTHRMQRLIDDLTDFGNIEAGTLAISLAPHDPSALVHEATEELREAAEKKV
ncbi:PAS domain-containing protein [Alkalilimnicola ehrlichii]|nr:PAS domain-containing protein [Alkalilimnicola ehrlichii]